MCDPTTVKECMHWKNQYCLLLLFKAIKPFCLFVCFLDRQCYGRLHFPVSTSHVRVCQNDCYVVYVTFAVCWGTQRIRSRYIVCVDLCLRKFTSPCWRPFRHFEFLIICAQFCASGLAHHHVYCTREDYQNSSQGHGVSNFVSGKLLLRFSCSPQLAFFVFVTIQPSE